MKKKPASSAKVDGKAAGQPSADGQSAKDGQDGQSSGDGQSKDGQSPTDGQTAHASGDGHLKDGQFSIDGQDGQSSTDGQSTKEKTGRIKMPVHQHNGDQDGQNAAESRKKNELLKEVLNVSGIGVTVYRAVRDKRGEIVDFEYLFVSNSGNDGQNGMEGRYLFKMFPLAIPGLQPLREMINTGIPQIVEEAIEKNNTVTWSRITNTKFEDGFVSIRQNITDQKKAEQKINDLTRHLTVQNRALKSLNSELQTFNHIAANDYKDTLRNIYTSLEYIARQDASHLTDVGKANVRRAQASIQKLKLLTEDIITYSTISPENRKTTVDLNEILEAVREDLGKRIGEENIEISCTGLPLVQGVPVLLSLLFHHLLDNAIKFRNPATPVAIHVSCLRHESSVIQHPDALPDTTYEIINVRDNGIGFDKQFAPLIFGFFYRIHDKKYKGSGIGLAVCKKIMDIHGGFIEAESEPSEGSTFRCYFPLEKI
jgi:signal transduction histidine kinase